MYSRVGKLLKQPERGCGAVRTAPEYGTAAMYTVRPATCREAGRWFVVERSGWQEGAVHAGHVSLAAVRQFGLCTAVDVGALDTVVIPVRDDTAHRERLFEHRRSQPLQLDAEKLQNLGYVAFCFGSPVGAITHCAKIRFCTPSEGDARKTILHFLPPRALQHPLEWSGRGPCCLRRPRYTAFAMLMEATSIDELFGQ